ncbi:hypothetical protein Bbelb_292110 [Branchiostoma belcheri]|nr:hypothetical protein Bbelb_292110 [Branchiostoma belcheri]
MANWTAELEAWKRRALAAEVTKKLAGAAAGTAAWVTNVGNEHGQILMSVLTAAEGQGLKPMGEGLELKHQDSCMWTSDCSCVRITPQPPRPLMVDDAALVCDHKGVLLPHPAVGPIQRPPDATLQLYNKRQKVQERPLLLQGVSQPSASTVSDSINSRVNEQANSGLIRIQPQLVYMSPSNFMFHASLFLALKNMRVCEDREVNVGCGADTTACISVKMQTYHASYSYEAKVCGTGVLLMHRPVYGQYESLMTELCHEHHCDFKSILRMEPQMFRGLLQRGYDGGHLPINTLYLQLDNSAKECKNKYILAFACWLVHLRIFRKVKLGYLMPGHTHEDMDQMLSRFSTHLQREDAPTVPELFQRLSNAYTPHPECSSAEHRTSTKGKVEGGVGCTAGAPSRETDVSLAIRNTDTGRGITRYQPTQVEDGLEKKTGQLNAVWLARLMTKSSEKLNGRTCKMKVTYKNITRHLGGEMFMEPGDMKGWENVILDDEMDQEEQAYRLDRIHDTTTGVPALAPLYEHQADNKAADLRSSLCTVVHICYSLEKDQSARQILRLMNQMYVRSILHGYRQHLRTMMPETNTLIPWYMLTRKYVRAHFQPHLERLSDFLESGEGVWWRKPERGLEVFLLDHLVHSTDTLRTKFPDVGIVILGDLNRTDTTNLCRGNFLQQVVDRPTRGDAILDVIITNIYSDSSRTQRSQLRRLVTQNDNCPKQDPPPCAIRAFGAWITQHKWHEVYNPADTEEKTKAFYMTLSQSIDHFFPTKTIKIHSTDKPWITLAIKSLIRERQKAFHQRREQAWKRLRNKVIQCIKQAKKNHYTKRVQQLKTEDPAKWYKELKSVCNLVKPPSSIQVPDVDSANQKAVADAINKYLASISQQTSPVSTCQLPAYLPASSPPPQIQPWDMYRELSHIRVRKAGGPDGIAPRIVKMFACELSEPLTDIFNTSLREGVVPSACKEAVVAPLPKDLPATVDKLRPISLTSIFANICEGFVAKWTMSDIWANIDLRQFGGIKRSSTTHCLVSLIHFLHKGAVTSKNMGTVVLTDFSKAFDTINHLQTVLSC